MRHFVFLNFLAEHGKLYSTFHLRMQAQVNELIKEGDHVVGVRAGAPDGTLEVRAGLVIGALAASLLSIRWGAWAVAAFATHPNTRKDGDPGAFVLDEVAGQWLALLLLPMSTWPRALTTRGSWSTSARPSSP